MILAFWNGTERNGTNRILPASASGRVSGQLGLRQTQALIKSKKNKKNPPPPPPFLLQLVFLILNHCLLPKAELKITHVEKNSVSALAIISFIYLLTYTFCRVSRVTKDEGAH